MVVFLLTAAALTSNALLSGWLHARGIFLIPMAAVFASATYGGLGPGLVATAVMEMGTFYFEVAPVLTLHLNDPGDLVWLALFAGLGVFASLFGESLLLTRQRYAELAAARERALATLDSLFDNASVGLTLLDGDLRITRVNRVVAETSHMPIEAHVGRTLQAVQPSTPTGLVSRLQHIRDTGEPMPPTEFAIALPGDFDRPQSWLISASPVLSPQGTILGVAVVSVGVTELRKAEAEARQAVADREELLAIVSHDLRSPLTAILLNAGVIKQRAPEAARQAEGILRAGAQMQQLIADILDVNRARQGHLTLHLEPVSVWGLVNEVSDTLKPQAAIKSLRIVQDIASDIGDVYADHSRLLQVLNNLVGNAIKFTPERGTITVAAAVSGGDLVLSVTDTGSGIAADQQAKIFERFWQAKKTEREGHGAGLGLAIAKGIVEAHHGHIAVRSTEGQGATFTVTLPLHGAEARQSA